MIERGVCANKFEELACLKGETIKGIFEEYDNKGYNRYIVFESGHAFVWRSNGSFWVTLKDDVKRKLLKVKEEMEKTKQGLGSILDMAGE